MEGQILAQRQALSGSEFNTSSVQMMLLTTLSCSSVQCDQRDVCAGVLRQNDKTYNHLSGNIGDAASSAASAVSSVILTSKTSSVWFFAWLLPLIIIVGPHRRLRQAPLQAHPILPIPQVPLLRLLRKPRRCVYHQNACTYHL